MTQAYTHRFTEVHEAPAGSFVPPQTVNGVPIAVIQAPWVNMAHHQRATYLVSVGNMGPGSFMLAEPWQARDANGLGANWISWFDHVVLLDQLDGDGDDLCVIELRTESMDINNGYCYAGLYILVVGEIDLSAISLYGASNQVPVPATAWTEIAGG